MLTKIRLNDILKMDNKKGVSVLIGYVLLVVFAVIMAAIIFTWLKSYVPAEALNCPDGSSVFVKESSFNDTTDQLKIVLKNNGRFDVAGYFIHATNSSSQEVATIDLSSSLSSGGEVFGNSVIFILGDNSLNPGDQETSVFDIPSSIGNITSVTIIPVRYQVEDNRERFVSCSGAKAESLIGEPVEEIITFCGDNSIQNPNSNGEYEQCDGSNLGGQDCTDFGFTEGTPSCDSNCQINTSLCTGGTIGVCGNGEINAGEQCDSGVNCIPPGETNECQCPAGYIADGSNGCTTIGNGVCNPEETCASAPSDCEGQQAQCLAGQVCQSGSCGFQGGTYNEDDYCVDIAQQQGLGYTGGNCANNVGQCTNPGSGVPGVVENDEPGAETYCPGTPLLCCTPKP